MATAEEIRTNAFKLEEAGASESEIEEYVSEASKEVPDHRQTRERLQIISFERRVTV